MEAVALETSEIVDKPLSQISSPLSECYSDKRSNLR